MCIIKATIGTFEKNSNRQKLWRKKPNLPTPQLSLRRKCLQLPLQHTQHECVSTDTGTHSFEGGC